MTIPKAAGGQTSSRDTRRDALTAGSWAASMALALTTTCIQVYPHFATSPIYAPGFALAMLGYSICTGLFGAWLVRLRIVNSDALRPLQMAGFVNLMLSGFAALLAFAGTMALDTTAYNGLLIAFWVWALCYVALVPLVLKHTK